MRKPPLKKTCFEKTCFGVCENKGALQLPSYAADQRIFFVTSEMLYNILDFLNAKDQADCTVLFVSDLV